MRCGEESKAGSVDLSCCRAAIFLPGPRKGKLTETAWSADKKLLEREHRALRLTVANLLRKPRAGKLLKQLYGIAFHDIYHAGQIRLLRRLMEPR